MAHDPSKPVKRLKYFTGQFLEAADFTAEQDYHLGMRLRGNRALYYSAGILDDGFNVTPAENDTKIEISRGIGVNTHGQEIVIVTPIRASLPVVGNERAYFVTLKYDDTPTDQQTPDQDISDNTRIEEMPIVEFIAEGITIDKDSIVIARVTVDAVGRVDNIDRNARQYTNAQFPGKLGIGKTLPGILSWTFFA